MKRTDTNTSLSKQMKRKIDSPKEKKEEYDGNFGNVISTGSTLLDLAISGGRVRGGGLPGGVLVEIFGSSGSGKTVLLSEIAGGVQRQNGEILFSDPEARLNQQFAKLFGLKLAEKDYSRPNTVPEVFEPVRTWKPKTNKVINGIFADSLAALSTDLEMGKDGDKMGTRRAKELSEECRKTCRILAKENYLMVCSNQIRQSLDAYGPKYKSPGGEAIGFYASLRLKPTITKKIKDTKSIAGKDVERIIGIRVDIEVFKSSLDKPYRVAPVTIIFDYGIDNIRENLQYLKTYTKATTYCLGDRSLDNSMDKAIAIIEGEGLENELREEVINLWEEIESKFKTERKAKR